MPRLELVRDIPGDRAVDRDAVVRARVGGGVPEPRASAGEGPLHDVDDYKGDRRPIAGAVVPGEGGYERDLVWDCHVGWTIVERLCRVVSPQTRRGAKTMSRRTKGTVMNPIVAV